MSEPDTVPVLEHGMTEDTPLEQVDLHDGQTLFSAPDNTNAVITQAHAAELVRQAVEKERRQYADILKGVLRVNTNKSGGIQFRRYSITGAMGALLIVKEKENRGNTLITVYGETTEISVGTDPGTGFQASNTVSVVAGTPRAIRTRNPLWVVCGSAVTTPIVFDVQEEFD